MLPQSALRKRWRSCLPLKHTIGFGKPLRWSVLLLHSPAPITLTIASPVLNRPNIFCCLAQPRRCVNQMYQYPAWCTSQKNVGTCLYIVEIGAARRLPRERQQCWPRISVCFVFMSSWLLRGECLWYRAWCDAVGGWQNLSEKLDVLLACLLTFS